MDSVDGQDDSILESQVYDRLAVPRDQLTPPLPGKIAIEINNSCNHKCFFCPNPTMDRTRSVMRDDVLFKVMQDAYDCGIRDLSFYSTGEPFLNKSLPQYVERAKAIGFEYVFLSSNGGSAVSKRLKPVFDAGLDSIKFSINAGTRDVYKTVHGIDDFESVMESVEFVAKYRAEHGSPKKFFVSFVETEMSKPTFEALKGRIGHLVDEVARYPFMVLGTPLKRRVEADGTERPYVGYDDIESDPAIEARLELPCFQLWSYLNVTLEGYLTACCSDFNNDLVVGNLNRMDLMSAWHSEEFQALRTQHINKQVEGTLCESCIYQKSRPYSAINAHLRENDR